MTISTERPGGYCAGTADRRKSFAAGTVRTLFAPLLILGLVAAAAPARAEQPVTVIERDGTGNWDLENVAAFKRDIGATNEIQVSVQLDLTLPEHARTAAEAISLCGEAKAVVYTLETALGPHLLKVMPQKWPTMRIRNYVVTAAGVDSLLASVDVRAIMRWVDAYGGFTESYAPGQYVVGPSDTAAAGDADRANPFRCVADS